MVSHLSLAGLYTFLDLMKSFDSSWSFLEVDRQQPPRGGMLGLPCRVPQRPEPLLLLTAGPWAGRGWLWCYKCGV